MRADGRAHHERGDVVLGDVALPHGAAVLHVLTQQFVGQARVAEHDGHGEIDAASVLHLLAEQVAAVFGAAGLAQHRDLAVVDGDDWLDGEQLAHGPRRRGDAAAALEVLERVEQTDHAHAIDRGLDRRGDLGGGPPLVDQAQGVIDQDVLAHGHALGVDHVHLGRAARLGRRRARALMRAGQLAGQRDDYHVLARLLRTRDGLGERIGIHLAGGGELVALDQQLVEALARQVDIGLVDRGPKAHGQREHVKLGMVPLQAIGTGVGDDADGHGLPFQGR